MRAKLPGVLAFGVLSSFLTLAAGLPVPARGEEAKKAAKINYEEQVSAVFKNRCNGCHNADKQKGGLNLETYGTAMQGGGSGKVIEPGDLDASTLYQLVSHKDEPTMPPNAPKIPEAEIELIKLWIEAGAPETSGSVAVVKARPRFEFKVDPSASGRPAGPSAMPEGLSIEPVLVSARPNAIVALATSPGAPLAAVGGYKQVLLYQTNNRHLVGVLPFPEGTVHTLKFSRNGALLLAGGGRGGQSGLVVVWDVKTGKRVFEVGKEYDAVLAADISADHGLVALGGPSKILRVYNTADGQLVYQSKKHTEWVTAVEFSPDGVLLASGDRNNGLIVWEAATGREFYDLRGHTAAITDVTWRPDSNVLASASEDGTVRLWEMETGRQIKSITAHNGGVLSAHYAQDGRLATTGRDRIARLCDASGNKLRDFEPFGELALEAAASHDGTVLIAGDWSGEVRVWDTRSGQRVGNLVANPAPLAVRIDQNQKDLAAAATTLQAFALVRNKPAEKAAALEQARRDLAGSQQRADQLKNEQAAAEKTLAALTAAEKTAAEKVRAARAAADKEKKAAADKAAALASEAAPVPAPESSSPASDALDSAETAAARAASDRAGAERALAALRAEAQKAAAALPVKKKALDQAAAEKTAADKALDAARPAIDAAIARVDALRTESEALAADLKRSEAAQSGLARSPAQP